MIIEISIAIIAVAFLALVIYLIAMINALRQTIAQFNQALPEIRNRFDEMGGQLKKTLEHTNQVTFDLKRKMESLDSTFNTISNLGEILEHKSLALKKESLTSLHRETPHLDADSHLSEREIRFHEDITTADILELASIGVRLWQKIKNKHSAAAKTKERRS
jgi:uncharacterized protein YoxC